MFINKEEMKSVIGRSKMKEFENVSAKVPVKEQQAQYQKSLHEYQDCHTKQQEAVIPVRSYL
jgi:hypothetical protein